MVFYVGQWHLVCLSMSVVKMTACCTGFEVSYMYYRINGLPDNTSLIQVSAALE